MKATDLFLPEDIARIKEVCESVKGVVVRVWVVKDWEKERFE